MSVLQVESGSDVQGAGRRAPYTPCFVEGTPISTDRGEIAIECLCAGDRVLTRDSGYRPIAWIGGRYFDADALADFPELQPIVIRRGALGTGQPSRDLQVSPQHRVLLSGALSLALTGETESLIAAEDLVGMAGVERRATAETTYFHILFDQHEVIDSAGCWTESFLPDAAALDGLHSAQAHEILTIFPELALKAPSELATARVVAKGTPFDSRAAA
ncbi:MAG: Hint domain-containing protein [Defluviimonas sp.]|uniref:Hint domain-containing protein n=1 Tax=Albidovulum sp. TaxID=1872424 RepID=UPI001D83C72B|nr:Hint domain-containing protein [Paracoccaceae bacterium]MCC0065037.1 Hint domain-containing protein [Defluviimonas sp.]